LTRIGVIADVHADVHALQDALARVERLGCELVLCAGDVVGYGLFPEETIALLRERSVVCVRGNHDRWALGDGSPKDPFAEGSARPRDASGWDLSRDARRFLKELPRSWHGLIEDVRVAMVHGTPRSELEGTFPDQMTGHELQRWLNLADADVLVVGHTHEPFRVVAPGGGVIVNPGILLRRPIEDREQVVMVFDMKKGAFVSAVKPTTGTFGVLELPSRRFGVHLVVDGTEVEIRRATKY
jgi:putative phosphoesterase